MKVEFELLANATDSIERAITLTAWSDYQEEPSRLKQSIQAIAHGVELLLKERLRRIHPALLWENVDKYPSLSARTVGSDGAISRLISVGGLRFTKSDIELIRSLRTTRNAIEHYKWSTTREEANHIIGQALAFALYFSKEHLGHEFFGYHTRRDDTFENLLQANGTFAAAIAQRAEETHSEPPGPEQQCSFCRAVARDPESGACRLCGHWEFPDKVRSWDDDLPF